MKEYKYFAFISYKREDEKWAKWMQKQLESFNLPVSVRKGNPALPNKIRPVFRDQSELAGGYLKDEIEKGLSSSRYLIVICSPRSAKSPWVDKEVQWFIDNGREEDIIPFIIDGKVNASDPDEECFPKGLRTLQGKNEILGINIAEMGKEAALIKVVARMFHLRFDELWQRHERAKKRKRLCVLGGVFLFALACLGVGIWTTYLNNEIIKERDRANNERERAIKANESLQIANNTINRTNADLEKSNLELEEANIQLAQERDNVLTSNWRMMENRARAVCEKAMELIADGDVYRGLYLLKSIYPINGDKPWVPEMDRVAMAAYDSIHFGRSPIIQMKGHEGEAIGGCISQDEILTTSNDGTVRFWDRNTGEEKLDKQIKIKDAIYEVAISPNKEWVAFPSDGYGSDGQIKLYRLKGKNYVFFKNLGQGSRPYFINDSLFQAYLVTKYPHTIWDTNDWSIKQESNNAKRFYNKDRTLMVVCEPQEKPGANGTVENKTLVYIGDFRTGNLLHYYELDGFSYYNAIFSPNSNYLALYFGHRVYIIDVEKGTKRLNVPIQDAHCMCFDNEEKYFYCISQNKKT